MKNKKTIQSQLFKTLSVLAYLVVFVTGFGVYVVYEAKVQLQQAIQDYDQSRRQIVDAQLALERIAFAYQMIYKSKVDPASIHMEMAKEGTVQILTLLDRMIDQSRESRYSAKQDIEIFRKRFLQAEGKEQTAAVQFLASKGTGRSSLDANVSDLVGLRAEIATLSERSLARYEKVQMQTLQSTIFLLVPILLGLLTIPVATFWAASRKINRDLLGYIRSLYDFSEQNEKRSDELRTSSELMSSASSHQASAIQQSVSAIAQIRTMLAETESHVREVQALASKMNEETLAGNEIVHRLQNSVLAIEEANAQIGSFEEILNSIRGKTQVINDIVFKTQLLSFNASIEAARAGQYGRGFSVVAEEVGKLAMMSGDAAREIDLLLAQSAERVSRIVESVQERVVDGKSVSHEAMNKFCSLTNRLNAISSKVDQVASAAFEQGGGIEQTEKAMHQISQGAAENKRGADEVQRVADRVFELSARIRSVTGGIRKFVYEDAPLTKAHQTLAVGSASTVRDLELFSAKKLTADSKPILGSTAKAETKVAFKIATPHRTSSILKEISADDPSFRKAGSQD